MASSGQMTGMLGVYLVAAELSRRNFVVSPTSRSAAGADLLATDQACSAFLDFVLFQYVKEGVGELDLAKLPHLLELKYRAVSDVAAELGGVAKIREPFIGFQAHLYAREPAQTSRTGVDYAV